MKATIEDVLKYSICPKLYSLKGDLPLMGEGLNKELLALSTFTLRKMLESGSAPSWKQVQTKWTKIFWQNKDTSDKVLITIYNRSQIGLRDFYGWIQSVPSSVLGINFLISSTNARHNLSGSIPGIIAKEDSTVELLYILGFRSDLHAKLNLEVQFLSAIMHNEISVSRITVMNLSHKGAFAFTHIYPDASYWAAVTIEMSSILSSMHTGLSYRNLFACEGCSVESKCLVSFGK